MNNKFESSKKLYIIAVDFLLLVFPTLFFSKVWLNRINLLLRVNFENKGNWLIIFCFVFVLAIMLYAFRGFKISYYKISNLLISQMLSIVCSHVILSIQMILMVGRVKYIGQITIRMLGLLVINCLITACITIIFVKIYNRLFPPYHLIHIYGDYQNNLKKKIALRLDKYIISKDIHFDELNEKNLAILQQYDGVVINDIPSVWKNKLLKYCFEHEMRVYFVPKISDIFIRGAEEINIFDTPLFLCRNIGLTMYQKTIKRLMDILISAIVLAITSPIMFFVALAIKIEDGGPVIFNQQRCSLNGKIFTLHKFRSMLVDAEAKNGAQLATKSDDRITKVGQFIRMTRLDELPQLVNVLKGDMSFVGPRPERPEFVEKNTRSIPEFSYRTKVKAGLTGYAQVFGKYNTSFLDKLKLDLIYIEKYSLLLDIQIILMTLKVILMKENAEGLDE